MIIDLDISKSADYQSFLSRKTHLGGGCGFEPIEIPDFLFPFQKNLIEWAIRRGRAALFEDCGLGKGVTPDCPIMTPEGRKPIGDLIIGDLVIGSDGLSYPVSGVYFKDEQDLYEIGFSDGVSIKCDGDHLWNVKSYNDVARGKPWRTMNTVDLAHTQLKYETHGQSRTWQIPLVRPVEFLSSDLLIHPYVFGVLMGDGSLTGYTVTWTKNDPEIAERAAQLLPDGARIVKRGTEGRTPVWAIISDTSSNPILDSLRTLGLMGKKSNEKFVPSEYLFSSIENRIALLNGLMDTDGYSGDCPEFSSSSRNLADAVVFLVQSIGGTASLGLKEEPTYTYNDEKRIGLPSWRVTMTMPVGINPFSLARKADKFKTPSRGLGRWIDSIKLIGRAKTVCITVDSPDSLFVVDNFIVTHNTPQQLVWADNVVRHTNGRVLILAPLSVGRQTIREATKFGFDAQQSRNGIFNKDIVVTNYEKLSCFRSSDFAGVVCDESSILKNFNGKTKAAVIEFMRTIPYRLLCTATAAPNDYIELGNSSESLGEMGFQDMITRFFKQEFQSLHTGWGRPKYRMRAHGENDFWRWVCSWARACRKPYDIGFNDDMYVLPKLNTREHTVVARTKKSGFLFEMPAITLKDQREERRRTINERCEMVADIVSRHDKPVVVWCHLNDEADLATKMIRGAVQVSGADSDDAKERSFSMFEDGTVRVMVSKPSVAGFGLNWQHCAHQTFFPSHSFEQWYQAIRRSYRFGQKNTVEIDMITTEGESGIMANLQRKADAAEVMFSKLVSLMNNQLNIDKNNIYLDKEEIPTWL